MPPKNTSGTPDGMRELLKKATTEMLVLFLLRQKPMYTYELMATVERLSDGRLTFNTLYQVIYRLQGFGYITESKRVVSDENRVRLYFSVTESGSSYLDALIAQYHATIEAVDYVLSLDHWAAEEGSNGKPV